MELQAFEVQVSVKTKTRDLEIAFFGKNLIDHRFCYFSIVSGLTKWDLNSFSIT